MTKGQLPRALGNLGQDPTQHQVLFEKIAPWMALKLRCQELIAKCSEATMENGLRTMSLDQERALDIILRTYEGQVDDLELQAVTGGSIPVVSIPPLISRSRRREIRHGPVPDGYSKLSLLQEPDIGLEWMLSADARHRVQLDRVHTIPLRSCRILVDGTRPDGIRIAPCFDVVAPYTEKRGLSGPRD